MMAYPFMIIAILVASAAYVTSDLCSIYSSIDFVGSNAHSICKSKSGSVSPADQALIVDNHNKVRREVSPDATNMMKMVWDEKAADVAQKWAESCPSYLHDKGHNRNLHGYYSLGQNGAEGQGTWQAAMDRWENEKNDWTYAAEPIIEDVGHYTQMIWAESDKIGCGYAPCSGRNIYICNYGKAGNMKKLDGTYQKPYISGTKGEACKTKDNGLCDCSGQLCRNGATLSPTTCACTCPGAGNFEGDECKLTCPTDATDSSNCGTTWPKSYCALISNLPIDYCPKMCGLCPALNGL